ncbi:hypothetical protein [Mycetocola zhadangensis]|uniref:PRC-barrel domain containing protein n=1 Tax=Mycetocola zhadangensis TaxID=1164595 RepID=A0A3L7J0W9_9MICO|nr:hypothetical protein [Mycetocola zhadangensis]RLQ84138.1 hypothetical protein D9V28_07865 [Mycetocola zhadangensis]GGE95852.1 hypothetical protein GCM10011313_18470 [Mycetocola zhadangensis]
MLDSRDIGGLQGAPVHGPDNEKIGNVHQVFVDAVTGAPNWVTLKTGFLGRHEIFAPLANSTWDGEILRLDLDKETLLAAPRLNADEGLSPHNEEALNRHFGLSDVDTDGGTARPAEEYPERTELLEQAAARQRNEEGGERSAHDAGENTHDSENDGHARETDEQAHDRNFDEQARENEAAEPVRDSGGDVGRESAPVRADLGDVQANGGSSGPRHAKPNSAL